MPEARLALELDRALGGEDAVAEARELAALLRAAAEPARLAVTGDEIDRALSRVQPVRRSRRRFVPAVALASAVVVVAVAVFLLRTPGTDVQARASRALDATFFVVEETRPVRPGLFPITDITGYVDGRRGRAHVRVSSPATGLVADTVLHADGSVERWQPTANLITVSPSCDGLPGGCAEALDPLDVYLRALDEGGVESRRVGSRYVLDLDVGRVDQRVVVDARTYLPRRIEWRQDGALIAVTRFSTLERQQTPPDPETWTMMHPGARVKQIARDGRPVRVLSARPARPTSALRWLGPTYEGKSARVEEVTLTGGHATRIAYGSLVVWNYASVVPPAVVQGRGLPAKVFAIPGGLVQAHYGGNNLQIAEAAFGDGNVGIVSATGSNVDVLRAVQRLTHPGSR